MTRFYSLKSSLVFTGFAALSLSACGSNDRTTVVTPVGAVIVPFSANLMQMGVSPLLTANNQLVGRLVFENQGSEDILLTSLTVQTEGTWASQPDVSDNQFELLLGGVTPLAFSRSDAANPDSTVPVSLTLQQPLRIQPSQTVEVYINYDTSGGMGSNHLFTLILPANGLRGETNTGQPIDLNLARELRGFVQEF